MNEAAKGPALAPLRGSADFGVAFTYERIYIFTPSAGGAGPGFNAPK
jgi:hypothetical protein